LKQKVPPLEEVEAEGELVRKEPEKYPTTAKEEPVGEAPNAKLLMSEAPTAQFLVTKEPTAQYFVGEAPNAQHCWTELNRRQVVVVQGRRQVVDLYHPISVAVVVDAVAAAAAEGAAVLASDDILAADAAAGAAAAVVDGAAAWNLGNLVGR
jgi:hypothetical protein